ncbi:hypothetical protein CBNA_2134 (plasmid) [Coxiella burnetii str. Namibia]|nr:hypothetical protein CBNA_2134 [Coxiella burnetii str. Namibia]
MNKLQYSHKVSQKATGNTQDETRHCYAREDDTIVVWKLERWDRSISLFFIFSAH